MSKVSNKNDAIQILRALAIIAVVVIHTYPSGELFGVVLRPFVNYAVAMFVFLSGYLTKTEIADYKTFMKKRILKVLVPYVLWSCLYMVPKGFDGFFIKLLTGRCCGIYYYIFVYIQFVLITPLVSKLIKSKFRYLGYFVTPVFMILFEYLPILMGGEDVGQWYKYAFCSWFIFYYLGMMVGNGYIKLEKSTSWYISIYILALAVSVLEGFVWYKLNNYNMATTQLRFTSVVASIVFLLWMRIYINKEASKSPSKLLLALGNTSFGIYLCHAALIGVLELLPVNKFLIFPFNTVVVLFVSCVCVTIGKKILNKYGWIMGL